MRLGIARRLHNQGAGDDFENAAYLIEHWGLENDLAFWKARAVEVMQQPHNLAAVKRVSEELLSARTIDWDDIGICCELADGETSEDDYAQFKAFRAAARTRQEG